MRHQPRSAFGSDQLVLPLFPVSPRRLDPALNMRQFYSLEVERDLFGRMVLVRRWGRIGTAGEVRLDEYAGRGRRSQLCTLRSARKCGDTIFRLK